MDHVHKLIAGALILLILLAFGIGARAETCVEHCVNYGTDRQPYEVCTKTCY